MVVSESVFLIKVLNLWLLTLISLVDINLSFNLLSVSVFVVVVCFFPLNSRHPSLLHLSKQATISQEKAQRLLLPPVREGGNLKTRMS